MDCRYSDVIITRIHIYDNAQLYDYARYINCNLCIDKNKTYKYFLKNDVFSNKTNHNISIS